MRAKNPDQVRAEYAWKCVKEQGQGAEYRSLAKSLPALIMTNGLMQSLLFLEGKGKEHHRKLLDHVYRWAVLGKREFLIGEKVEFDISRITEMSSEEYQRATEEAVEILKWIRLMADALA